MIKRLLKRGILAPGVLGYGVVETAGGLEADILLTREVEKSRPLQDLVDLDWESLQPQRKRKLIESFAAYVKALHDAGVVHNDPHLGNILLQDTDGSARFVLLDADNVVLHGRPLTTSERVKNLVSDYQRRMLDTTSIFLLLCHR